MLTYLKDVTSHQWINELNCNRLGKMIQKGNDFLISVQNNDRSWGGDKSIPGSMEETALAVSALASPENMKICNSGLDWLNVFYMQNGFKPAPIGLYFASLWYDEKMYPATAYLEALTRMQELKGE